MYCDLLQIMDSTLCNIEEAFSGPSLGRSLFHQDWCKQWRRWDNQLLDEAMVSIWLLQWHDHSHRNTTTCYHGLPMVEMEYRRAMYIPGMVRCLGLLQTTPQELWLWKQDLRLHRKIVLQFALLGRSILHWRPRKNRQIDVGLYLSRTIIRMPYHPNLANSGNNKLVCGRNSN